MLVCLMPNSINKKALSLIIGNGYLGSHLAPLLKTELSCGISRRLKNQNFIPATGEFISFECDIFNEKKLNKLSAILDNTLMDVYFMLPPSTFPSNEPARALEPLFSLLSSLAVRRIVVVSSSSVYGTQREGLVNPEPRFE